jgi:polyphosphate kinase 2 (PPK2 family)
VAYRDQKLHRTKIESRIQEGVISMGMPRKRPTLIRCPWGIIDPRLGQKAPGTVDYRRRFFPRCLLDLEGPGIVGWIGPGTSTKEEGFGTMSRLGDLDLGLHLSRQEGDERLVAAQRRLLHLRLVSAGLLGTGAIGPPLCVIFEGWDAAGKGGAIKRLVYRLDPRHVTVTQFAVPSEEERRHHFLWRFSSHLPGWGEMGVFDRSWYGRVLVERVDGLATEQEWKRAYQEIVHFERSLVGEGVVLVKFFLHISVDEQLRRFESREKDPLRAWKLTGEDWHNRGRRDAYLVALEEVFDRTEHKSAPWELVAAEDKRYARVQVLETVIARLEQGLVRSGIPPPPSSGTDFDPLS